MDRLRKEYEGKVEFRVYDIDGPGGEAGELAGELGVQYVPTFVFVNADESISAQVVGGMAERDLRGRLDALE
ncbi:MAG: thioredoxin family protein [Coriobacteriia bacterium]|nr:thioredoxin family protein [Coriobacteriia bacterium]